MRTTHLLGFGVLLPLALILLAVMVSQLYLGVRGLEHDAACYRDLKQLGAALLLYRDNQGKAVEYPAYDGKDFLIALYAAEVCTEPDFFFCRQQYPDDYRDGAELVLGADPPGVFLGRQNRVQDRYPGLFTMKGASETTMAACDPAPFQRGGVCLLFADLHVERHGEIGSARLGQVGERGLLAPLARCPPYPPRRCRYWATAGLNAGGASAWARRRCCSAPSRLPALASMIP